MCSSVRLIISSNKEVAAIKIAIEVIIILTQVNTNIVKSLTRFFFYNLMNLIAR